MGMTRTERRASHKKQSRLRVSEGEPSAREVVEGIPELRYTTEGLVEYVNFRGVLYKNVFARVT
jgi:hypothetical protein